MFVAVAQTIFSHVILHELAQKAPDVDAMRLLLTVSAAVRRTVTPQQLLGALEAFNKAITSTFYFTAGTPAATFFLACGIEWRSVQEKNLVADIA